MALLGFLRSWDEREGEPVLKDQSTILAYIEDLIRIRSFVQFWLKGDDMLPIAGRIDLLSELSGHMTITLQRALPGDIQANTAMEMMFTLEGMRFDAPVKFLRRDGYLRAQFSIPEKVRHAERRTKMRARFGPREKATCTLLEDLFEGHGAAGRLVNLSMEGLCMRIDRAISIRENRQLGISNNLFDLGKSLAVVRIQNLPHTPLIECCGKVTHIESTSIGVLLGLHLQGLGSAESQWLSHVLARRLPSFARGFPVRHRRGKEELIDEIATNPEQESEADWQKITDESEDGAVDIDAAEELVASRPDTHERLLQIKKRGKKILLVIQDDLDRAILSGTLQVDGFRQIHEAGSVVEVLRAVRGGPPDLIILEPTVGNATAQQLLERLRSKAGCESVPAIMITNGPDVRMTLMAKASKIQHVQSWPVDYDGVLKDVISKLLVLE